VFTSTAGQTTFTVTNGYNLGMLDVFVNGVKFVNGVDYTATNGTTVVLTDALTASQIVEIDNYLTAFLPTNALRTITTFTATAGQTTFSVTYTQGLIDVYYNGSCLAQSEYTATNGTSIILATACQVNDIVVVYAYNYSVGAYSGIGGSGTTNFVPKFTSSSVIGNSLIFDNGTSLFIGNGQSSATPQVGIIEGTDGSGTNIAGAEFRIQGGQGTGTGVGGAVTFYTAPAGSTGSSLNTAVERMRVSTAGNVGIGTSSPGQRLTIVTSGGSPSINIFDGTTDCYLGIATTANGYANGAAAGNFVVRGASGLAFSSNGGTTTAMRIESNGTTQIIAADNQTTNGGYNTFGNLFVASATAQGTGIGGAISIGGRFNGAGEYATFARIQGKKENSSSGQTGGYLAFEVNTDVTNLLTERGRFTSGGYFKATSNSSYLGSNAHELVQSLNNNQIVTNTHNGTIPYGLEVNFQNADPNNATNWMSAFYVSSPSFVWVYRIFSNGTVASRSDARWKKNIETTRNGYLEDLCKLRVVKYNWYNHEEDAPKELGLIAQEVEEVFPNLVQYDKVTTKKQVEQEDGTFIEQEVEDGESRSIKISVLPYMLLKALQEANAKIDELKAEVEQLKQK
jgi:hypothetical protein